MSSCHYYVKGCCSRRKREEKKRVWWGEKRPSRSTGNSTNVVPGKRLPKPRLGPIEGKGGNRDPGRKKPGNEGETIPTEDT